MSITESSSKTSISQEVENPSSFNFFIPPLKESLSTPVCGVGEMDESISPVCHVLHSENMLVCSHTLVLSSDKSPNSEAHSVSKPNEGFLRKKLTLRLFEGDLPEGKGPESCILTAGAELMAVQSIDSLRGDVQPTFLEHELESPDQVPHRSEPIFDQTPKSVDVMSEKEEEKDVPLRWRSRGMRGRNQSQVNVLELETVKNKRKYATKSETQKFMGSVIAATKAHTERTRKRRREGLEPDQPASTPLIIENSETESEDASKIKNQNEEKELTREERVEKMEQQRVLNGRVFDPDILTTFGWNHLFQPPVPYLHEPEVHEFFYKMELLEGGGITTIVRNVQIHLDEETLGIIMGVPVAGVRTIEGCKPIGDFSKLATKRGDVKRAGLSKKFLKGEYQLMFEFINKVVVPRTEKRTVASAADLFLEPQAALIGISWCLDQQFEALESFGQSGSVSVRFPYRLNRSYRVPKSILKWN
ncbi:hypothetical protein H5410_031803 [Solanum commersonii]|uniref:Uncharacterized protein n=1 Tax=Solanum commersonii TaxID=4109 RepID=A0A9J5YJC2_SOLCO|nr:hypothetical protein H5410_031803 [Solanum commersonii]